MALTPLQDLLRRVALLEQRRGPDNVIAQITEVTSQPSSGGPTSYYHLWRFSVRMLDGEFRAAGGEITNVAALQAHLTPDGTLNGQVETSSFGPHSHDIVPAYMVPIPMTVGGHRDAGAGQAGPRGVLGDHRKAGPGNPRGDHRPPGCPECLTRAWPMSG